jgi:hypothetical protein
MAVGYGLWIALFLLDEYSFELPHYIKGIFLLVVGLIIQVVCQIWVTGTERFAGRMDYVEGTASEVLSTCLNVWL